jgi:ABC-type multidrug transport system ATPase subunit
MPASAADLEPFLSGSNVTLARGRRLISTGEFAFDRHDRVAILGENGSGKSTLCLALAGLLPIKSGELRRSAAFRTTTIGFLPQSGGLYPHLSVSDNVAFFRKVYGAREVFDPRGLAMLWELGLGEVLEVEVRALSGGYIRLAALACVLAVDAKALFLDEPMSGLDDKHRGKAEEVIERIAETLDLLVVTGHRRNDVPFCNKVVEVGGAAT